MNKLERWKQYEGKWVNINYGDGDECVYGLETINEIYAKVWSLPNPMSQYVYYTVSPTYLGTIYINDIRPAEDDEYTKCRREDDVK